MNPLHEQFVAEARELVLQTGDDLIGLERDGFDPARIERIMRAFHTLKGSAGVVQLPAMTIMLHAAEDMMVAVQAGQLFPSSDLISDALACMDLVSRWVDAFEATGELPPLAGEEARETAERLRSRLSGQTLSTAPASAATQLPEWATRLMDKASGASSGKPLTAILYEPHAGCFYDGDDPLGLLRKIPGLVALNMGLGKDQALTDLDPYDCHLRLAALATGSREELAAVFRSVPDQVRFIDIPNGAPARGDGPENKSTLARAIIAEQRAVLRVPHPVEHQAGCFGSAARAAANAFRHAGRNDLAERIAQAGVTAVANRDAGALDAAVGAALEQLDQDARPAGQPPSLPDNKGAATDGLAGRTLRIDEARVESLVNLAGELIVLKNSFGHLVKRAEMEKASQEVVQLARHEHERISRLADEIQGSILQLRMVPFSQVMRAFPRLVRDLSLQLGKDVRLVTQGETTEGDKTVVDRLFEPLLHIVRNALDHGIESPEARAAVGKASTGTISMQASRAGDRLVVEVTDDGRGIDPSVIRRKAIEMGLLTDDKSASVSDEAVLDLVFSAGFSTASEASDISGRGVGMDVVRTIIDHIGGRVTLRSQVGKGTTIRLDVPVNIATSRIMVVECAGQLFGVPMDHVVETLRLTPDRISQVKNNEGFVLRDRVVPICSLAEILNLPAAVAGGETRLVMVTEAGGKVAGVEVDAIHDRMDAVLKPMQGLLSQTRGYSGTTLLGDGAVLLVVDLKEVLP
jgi:two-component system chemotaxis sensor kinase CheA